MKDRIIKDELSKIKNFTVEDVLGRDEIVLSDSVLLSTTVNKSVLITGAAGSIGSELFRQILNLQPRVLILVD
ncbi:MAG: polysaccharide biosynthesis protein [Bacteroidetes bacterium]|nr:polysaccharide biosynthesis protein [Bacteroidota bacterium]